MATPVIAVINTDSSFLSLVDELLTNAGYRPLLWLSSRNTYGQIRQVQPALLILDIPSRRAGAAWALLELLRLDPETAPMPILVCAVPIPEVRNATARLNALRCSVLEKPFNLEDLLTHIQALVRLPPSDDQDGHRMDSIRTGSL